ncbi:hypothetical protein [Xylophilus sp. GOD-11R]|uniref:hypothetical protein n=1 Tax=Xylophilus sp. GOD-11R TaxID=3089814 RepID=UPI00298CE2C5|nr:hypothetical protein [Xylophilus sp. GOD-11R]WPB56192.1 hypothetical protein R9X41_18900 [Xylophilus sp. GOD-11R]
MSADSPLGGLPKRIEDLPAELWLRFADYLDARNRATLLGLHPVLADRADAAAARARAMETSDVDQLAAVLNAALDGRTPAGYALTRRERRDIVMAIASRACRLLDRSSSLSEHASLNAMLVDGLDRLDGLDNDEASRVVLALLQGPTLRFSDPDTSMHAGQNRLAGRVVDRLCEVVERGSAEAAAAIAREVPWGLHLIRLAAHTGTREPSPGDLLARRLRMVQALGGDTRRPPPADAHVRLLAALELSYHLTDDAAAAVVPTLARLLDASRCDSHRACAMTYLCMLLRNLGSADARTLLEAAIRYAGQNPVDGSMDDGDAQLRCLWSHMAGARMEAADARAMDRAFELALAKFRRIDGSSTA